MKQKKILKAVSLAMLLCALLTLWGCNGKEPAVTTSGDAAYKVTIRDALGAPYTTGVVVRFLQNGQQAAMQVVNEQGIAEKILPRGEYTVELSFTDDPEGYYYDITDLKLTADKTEAQVTLSYRVSGGMELFAGGREHTAYGVGTGSTYVELAEGRNYYLFTPSQPGTYEFSVTDTSAAIGYYGAPHFVQELTAAEVVDGKFTVSVRASMIGSNGTGTTVIVVGVDKGQKDSCLLNIQRIGEPAWSVEDEPWMIYPTPAGLTPYNLGEEPVTFGEFDLTAATDTYKLVLNESDGFYHLGAADGPVVLVRLGKDTKYLPCFQTMLDRSGVVKYFYDENGTFIKKESYSECLLDYIAKMDSANGVYPLTEDLKYIIQQRGEFAGWFDEASSVYIFKDAAGNLVPGINPEISWLFMCCYLPVT